jgi:Family of unknown function (DUF6665)
MNGTQVVALDYEIAQERASALGRLGRALEAALAALSAYDGMATSNPATLPASPQGKRGIAVTREQLVRQASDALWCFAVQREACGLRDLRPVLHNYRVPREVYAGMGVFGRR